MVLSSEADALLAVPFTIGQDVAAMHTLGYGYQAVESLIDWQALSSCDLGGSIIEERRYDDLLDSPFTTELFDFYEFEKIDCNNGRVFTSPASGYRKQGVPVTFSGPWALENASELIIYQQLGSSLEAPYKTIGAFTLDQWYQGHHKLELDAGTDNIRRLHAYVIYHEGQPVI